VKISIVAKMDNLKSLKRRMVKPESGLTILLVVYIGMSYLKFTSPPLELLVSRMEGLPRTSISDPLLAFALISFVA
jgi:hypothetical protein